MKRLSELKEAARIIKAKLKQTEGEDMKLSEYKEHLINHDWNYAIRI